MVGLMEGLMELNNVCKLALQPGSSIEFSLPDPPKIILLSYPFPSRFGVALKAFLVHLFVFAQVLFEIYERTTTGPRIQNPLPDDANLTNEVYSKYILCFSSCLRTPAAFTCRQVQFPSKRSKNSRTLGMSVLSCNMHHSGHCLHIRLSFFSLPSRFDVLVAPVTRSFPQSYPSCCFPSLRLRWFRGPHPFSLARHRSRVGHSARK
ncbi:hypothetical protein K402DRAFT_134655 [Aulographum hederae CBS 113979]|uniref:Uncharacterized protein n=1 Tax=Aulographum hederae CBS 113979 TaxID=1176131 RepID=A0A6G1GVD4_9PEZI|nr:hypothetical protein K402DRAFT_134655 [Aulographum hederae CBS 113979]